MNMFDSDQSYVTLRGGLVLHSTQQEALEVILNDLFNQISASFILLADITGQPISSRGDQSQVNIVAVASLVAGDLAASQEIARLTGVYEECQMVLREGRNIHTYIIEVGHHMALMVQISKETPLGWARILIQRKAQNLADVIANASGNQSEVLPDLQLGQNDLSDLFSDALDEMWNE